MFVHYSLKAATKLEQLCRSIDTQIYQAVAVYYCLLYFQPICWSLLQPVSNDNPEMSYKYCCCPEADVQIRYSASPDLAVYDSLYCQLQILQSKVGIATLNRNGATGTSKALQKILKRQRFYTLQKSQWRQFKIQTRQRIQVQKIIYILEKLSNYQ